MIARVLFVCAQNVCRSPLMAAAFAGAVADGLAETDDRDWAVRSGGTHAHEGRTPCPFVVALAPAAARHRSMAIDREDIMLADLVIAVSREERSWIAQQVPESRQTTFTLREALLLDDRMGARPLLESVGEYVAALNAHRGTIEILPPVSRPWRRRPRHPLDVPDVHGAGRHAHRRALTDVARDAADLGRRVRESLLITA